MAALHPSSVVLRYCRGNKNQHTVQIGDSRLWSSVAHWKKSKVDCFERRRRLKRRKKEGEEGREKEREKREKKEREEKWRNERKRK